MVVNLCLAIATSQNHQRWTNLARICKKYQLSDRTRVAINTSTLQGMGLVTDEDKSLVIDLSKLRRERKRCKEEILQLLLDCILMAEKMQPKL